MAVPAAKFSPGMPGALESPPGYSVKSKLGEGGFGSVFMAINLRTNRHCALKSIDISTLSKKYREAAIKQWILEVGALLKVTTHPNVVSYRNAFDTGWKLWVEMEFCAGGDLSNYFKLWTTRISRTIKRSLMLDIAAAVSYLHKQGIVHRDIKAENVLIAYHKESEKVDVRAKIADFGLAKVIATCNFDGSLENYYMDCTCGTRYYLAPEVLEGKYTLKADIFSMGVLYTAIVTETRIGDYMTSYIKDAKGKCCSFGEVMVSIKSDVALRSSFSAGTNLRKLINSMLLYNFHNRPTAQELYTTLTGVSAEEFPKNPQGKKRPARQRATPTAPAMSPLSPK